MIVTHSIGGDLPSVRVHRGEEMDPGVVHQGNHVLQQRKTYILMIIKHMILFKCCPPRQPRPGEEENIYFNE